MQGWLRWQVRRQADEAARPGGFRDEMADLQSAWSLRDCVRQCGRRGSCTGATQGGTG
jgi:hypothetical protein